MVKQFQETKETIWLAITFPGCFTFIRTKPKDGDDLDYCHIRFIGPLDQPGLIYGSNTCSLPPPKLRQRRRPLGGIARTGKQISGMAMLSCATCKKETPALNGTSKQSSAAHFC
ncbi:hypothetical protein [Candidatus Vondammii sp. HM_W22]|uniref:hypothetical protein n=1 Tax=Candidatus Vondammii sp. HM_W22 TaxID=2687299 RepID=UPI001F146F90|nr:hypothetical protein [Candidatus Vondammii sp. HM_W22]